MAINLKVFLAHKSFYGQDILLMGRALRMHAYHNFPDALIIESEQDITSAEADFEALIYTNTPLCDYPFLIEKCSEMLASPFSMLKIGDGYLRNLKCPTEKNTICTHLKALRVDCPSDISIIYAYLKKQSLFRLACGNVFIIHPDSTHIDSTVTIGEGSIIHAMVCLQGDTRIGCNTEIFPYSHLTDTTIGDNTKVYSTFAESAKIGNNCMVGPYSCLRAGTVIADRCRIGPYVEIKKSRLDANVKAAHLAYIGDSQIGSGTNVGCGTVFANYDGQVKHPSKVGKNVFIGANCNLIAPINIGNNAFIAAGSTISTDLPDNSFCIARSREVIKPDYPIKSKQS